MKIVCVGCSFTDHYTDEDETSWPEILANKLPQHTIYNLGVSASGWLWHDLMIKYAVLELEPDLILFQESGPSRYHLFFDYDANYSTKNVIQNVFDDLKSEKNYYYPKDEPRMFLNDTVAWIINDTCNIRGEKYSFYRKNGFLPVNDDWGTDLVNQNFNFYNKVGINIHTFSLRLKNAKPRSEFYYDWDNTDKSKLSKSSHLSTSENEKLVDWIIKEFI